MLLLLVGGLTWPQGFVFAEDGRRDGRDDTSEDTESDNGEDHDNEDNDGEDHDGEDKDGEDKDGEDNDGEDKDGEDDGSDDNEEYGGEDDDQNRAINAVRNDHAASLKEVLVIVREKHEGEIVHVSLSGSTPNLIYHIKILDKSDRLIDVQIDPLSRKIFTDGGS